ncbi:MAG: hypothetical protein NXI31_26480 [bacterium]|nr:hypothetical protein [bacterium]
MTDRETTTAATAAHDRLLDILLEEQARELQPVAAPHDSGSREALDDIPIDAPSRQRTGWLVAAAVLLGVATVATTAWLQREAPPAAPASRTELAGLRQDPKGRENVKVTDADHLRRLIAEATGLRVTRSEVRGAARNGKDPTSGDGMVTRVWAEDFRCRRSDDDGTFAKWAAALTASLPTQESQNSIVDVLSLELELPENRSVSMLVCANGNPSWFAAGGLDPFVATEALAKLVSVVSHDIMLRHEIARGRVPSLADVDRLPQTATRLETKVDATTTAKDLRALARFAQLRSVVLRGNIAASALAGLRELELESLALDGVDLEAKHFAAIVRLSSLEQLSFRRCGAFAIPGGSSDAPQLRTLGQLKNLRALECINTSTGEQGEALADLIVFPNLEAFALRQKGLELTAEKMAPLTHTKLRRLLLVDVETSGEDLATLGGLPSFEELIVVGMLTDADLESLAELQKLTTLRLRNNRITYPAAEEYRAARPEVELDWQLDARFFDTELAFTEWQ